MKTIDELYREVMTSEDLKKELLSLKPEEVEGFAAKHGCEAGLDEIRAFLEARQNVTGTISDDEMAQVSGGVFKDVLNSVATCGAGCVASLILSAIDGTIGDDGQICSP